MAATGGNTWAFVAGVFGNIISFLVFFAPVPTFYKIYKKKSTESFDSVPYIVALFSAMLWLYFALLTSDMLLMTINSAGCVIEGIYVAIFLIYANKKTRAFTLKLIFLMNVGLYGSILVLTLLFTEGKKRVSILGWTGSTFAFAVFVAPMSVIRLVIKTKSVEYMPFMLSFFLTLSAVAWFFYGLLTKDFYVALPNVLGFIFGTIQMSLFLIYKNGKKMVDSDQKPAETPLESMEVKIPISAIQEKKSSFENNPVVKEVDDDETKINHKLVGIM